MLNNEITLDKGSKFITRYGTTLDEKLPSVVYLRTKSKITPSMEMKDYNDNVIDVKDKFTSFVKKTIITNKSVNDDYLFNIDISSKSVRYGKVSFLRYDLYLKPTKSKTIEENLYRIKQLSIKLDKKLENLLNSNNIICK